MNQARAECDTVGWNPAEGLELTTGAGRTSLAIDSDPNAEPFYLACGALRFGSVPASLRDQPDRFRPQLRLAV